MMATYTATKAFVLSFTETIEAELAGTGVPHALCVCPGFTRTEFEQAAGAEDAASKLPGFTWMESDDVARQAIEGMIAGKRTVVPGAHQQGGVDERALHPADGAAPARQDRFQGTARRRIDSRRGGGRPDDHIPSRR